MNKIFLIIQREFLTRVRKKSFIIMSILGPFLFAAITILPIVFATMGDKEVRLIAVIDSSKLFTNKIPETEFIKFRYLNNITVSTYKQEFSKSGYYAMLYIPADVVKSPDSVKLFSNKQPGFNITEHIKYHIGKEIERIKLQTFNIENIDNILASVKTNVEIQTIKWGGNGKEKQSFTEIAMITGQVSGMLIYFFIFLYGAQVMRGVIEEKTNRIIEVIISSVKPFQLMFGKIIGIGMVGLTQFLIWVLLTASLIIGGQKILIAQQSKKQDMQMMAQTSGMPSGIQNSQVAQKSDGSDIVKKMMERFGQVNIPKVLTLFVFFFIGGYLLYAALFAAVGSAVDNDTDTQQFMLPITVPLIFAIIIMINTIQNPEGPLAFWFSLFPFTSPIIMMVRIPFDPPAWQIALSLGILALTFIFTTWMAGKIYRTGILMYGKKATYAELWKWLKYKN